MSGTQEAVKTWRWRIVKSGRTISKFGYEIGIKSPQLSQYLSGKVSPSLETFDRIEGKLRELGV